MIIKFNLASTLLIPGGNYHWDRVDPALPAQYVIQRQQAGGSNKWFILISILGCTLLANVDQNEDETLWVGADDIDFDAFGVCAGDPPIDTLAVKMYRTQEAALVDFPDLQEWDWS